MTTSNQKEVGTVFQLRGITLRGKNRVQRGGPMWIVKRREYDDRAGKWKLLVISSQKGHSESFWMNEPPHSDPHVETHQNGVWQSDRS